MLLLLKITEDNFADAGYNLKAKSAESNPELREEALCVNTVADFGGNLATAVTADAPDNKLADSATVEPFSVHYTLVGETAKAKYVVAGDGNSADQGYEECEDWTLHMADEETVALLALFNDFQCL